MAERVGTNHRKEWPFSAWSGEWLIVRQADVLDGEETSSNPVWLPHRLRAAASEAFAQRVILDIASDLWGPSLPQRTATGGKEKWLRLCSRLEDEFSKGTLVLVRPPALDTRKGSESSAKDDRDEGQYAKRKSTSNGANRNKPELTWVSVRLVDQNNVPIANEAYRVVLPDGSTRDGTLSSAGEVWFEDIPFGNCQISFPNLDGREWQPA